VATYITDLGDQFQANGNTGGEAPVDFTVANPNGGGGLTPGTYRYVGRIYDVYESTWNPFGPVDKGVGGPGDDNAFGVRFVIDIAARVSFQITSPGLHDASGACLGSALLGGYPAVMAKASDQFIGGLTFDNDPSTAPWTWFQETLS